LQSHYRSPIDFSDAALTAAQSGFDKISEAVIEVRRRVLQAPEGKVQGWVTNAIRQNRKSFEEAMNDDLNTSVALSVIFKKVIGLVKRAKDIADKDNKPVTRGSWKAIDSQFHELGGDVLGIVKDEYPEAMVGDEDKLGKVMDILIEQRQQARLKKDFFAADSIRDKLANIGILLEDDQNEVTTWRWK